ncbi:MAG: polyprenyl synthetase family protein [Pseudomonadota bacterium]|nr:polyprenyl synthetase family protein [Pseudomonadota bacterium]
MDLESIKSHITTETSLLESEILERIKTKVELINTLSGHILSGGGKRLRPSLLFLAQKACSEKGEKIIEAGVVVEFIHAATLLHDDVVDQSKIRHGEKTANNIWGNPGAVLVGDFLYSRAFEIIVEINNPRVYEILAHTTNIISQGEVLQLMNLNNPDMDEKIYLEIINRKTARLFQTSAEIGSILSGDDIQKSKALANYGYHFGMAYQLRNDLLDYFGDEKITGKNLVEDFSEGKLTLPLIHAIKVSNNNERDLIKTAIQKSDLGRMQDILQILKEKKIEKYIQDKIILETNNAIDSLKVLSESIYKKDLIKLAEYCSERER